jgi:3-hydroxybutyryl-CoA dehydrogenase
MDPAVNRLRNAPILVVGAGTMGAGIAQVAALAGHAVALHDVREGAAAEAAQTLQRTFEALVAKGKLAVDAARAAAARVSPIAALKEAAGATLAVEAVVEKIEAKHSLFRQIEEILPADAVLATNTSSISITAIANGLRRPARVVGMHFFNPVPLMQLAVLQGVCSENGADAAMKLAVNYPSGPFEWLRDFGVDGVVRILEALDRAHCGERYRVSPWLRRRSAS